MLLDYIIETVFIMAHLRSAHLLPSAGLSHPLDPLSTVDDPEGPST